MEALVEQAPTYEKCIEKIEQKFGPGIRITRRESIRTDGFLGLGIFQKEMVQITFSIINEPFIPKTETKADSNTIGNGIRNKIFIPPDENDTKEHILKNAISQSPTLAKKINPLLNQRRESNDDILLQQSEDIKRLNNTIHKLMTQIDEQRGYSSEHENIKNIISILEENDFTNKYIYSIKEKINNELTLKEIEDFQYLQKKVIKWIAASICIKKEAENNSKKVIALVGPTGIGKTTTIAKIAAYYIKSVSKRIGYNFDVRMITLDQFRIGASYQIQKYCEWMSIPLVITTSPTDLRKYLSLYKDSADIVCIDTTGRSPSDAENISKMQVYFDVIKNENVEVNLMISAVTKAGDIYEIMKQYSAFNYSSVIVSKLDETLHIGSIISVLSETKIPTSYVTTGQKVPNDIERASKFIFLKRLTGFRLDEGYNEYIAANFNDEITIVW